MDVLKQLEEVILSRKNQRLEGSYTSYLFEKGIDKILKKCGEENAEMIIAAKNNIKEEVIMETSDLIYHIMVMLISLDISINDVEKELKIRLEKQKNLKERKETDLNS